MSFNATHYSSLDGCLIGSPVRLSSSSTQTLTTTQADIFVTTTSLAAGTWALRGVYTLKATADASFNNMTFQIAGNEASPLAAQLVYGNGATTFASASGTLVNIPLNCVFIVDEGYGGASITFKCTPTFSAGTCQRFSYALELVRIA